MSKLYVGNLALSTTDDTLHQTFVWFGMVVEAMVVRGHGMGCSCGFGFITYSSVEEANSAMTVLNKMELEGKIIKASHVSDHGQ
ncbi:hypothetical protein BJ085DRAFT_13590 [Dimargaris cristalligena]|uniref:RRM domain-containing protein n=1 Tax=Dimargaris cristalligena TaxID=215637 RepID=A0A4V1J471_9FUNG|nr:hypothetical protein BJ085DRAFT_13590 [Dimargaris cristalligena]|eukprot:RKP34539.1 hypothetical protein BJ085DRAFT_13590 [Dimargaris cristalligena]